ncbi:hypothetical protein BLOT_006730 [Blomia tropicalis]|nr:hypothetical protein BLOT_006730 [Blomia tropicalis]
MMNNDQNKMLVFNLEKFFNEFLCYHMYCVTNLALRINDFENMTTLSIGRLFESQIALSLKLKFNDGTVIRNRILAYHIMLITGQFGLRTDL